MKFLDEVMENKAWFPAYIGVGSNLGKRIAYLQNALNAFGECPEIGDVVASPVYQTKAHTLEDTTQPDYFNAVFYIQTSFKPAELLAFCLALELENDRVRSKKWASRTLDLDVLLHGDTQSNDKNLILPHPRMAERRFVLKPLNDLAPALLLPLPFNKTVAQLLAECPDETLPQVLPFRLNPIGKNL